MAAEHEPLHVLHGDAQRLGDKRPVARRIEHARHADDAVLRKPAHLVSRLRHGVERVGDHDQNRVRRILHRLLDGALHHVVVGLEQIVAAHAGLAREAGGHHHQVGVGGVGVIVRAPHAHVVALDGSGLEQVQSLALRDALQDVDHDHVGELLVRQAMGHRCAHVPRANHGHFSAHESSALLAVNSFSYRWKSPRVSSGSVSSEVTRPSTRRPRRRSVRSVVKP